MCVQLMNANMLQKNKNKNMAAGKMLWLHVKHGYSFSGLIIEAVIASNAPLAAISRLFSYKSRRKRLEYPN